MKKVLITLLVIITVVVGFDVSGSVYCDSDSTLADCGDIILRKSGTAIIDTACITSNGDFTINIDSGDWYFWVRTARKQDTDDWFTSPTPVLIIISGSTSGIELYAPNSCSTTPWCDCNRNQERN